MLLEKTFWDLRDQRDKLAERADSSSACPRQSPDSTILSANVNLPVLVYPDLIDLNLTAKSVREARRSLGTWQEPWESTHPYLSIFQRMPIKTHLALQDKLFPSFYSE